MSPSGHNASTENLPPAPVNAGGTYTIQQVKVGCKIYIKRPGPDGQEEERLAEILSIRDKPNNPYARRSASTTTTPSAPEDKWEFFVHWDTFNKRLDEWVAGSRLILSRDLEWPRPKPPPPPPKKLTGAAATAAAQKQNAIGKAPRSRDLFKKAIANAAASSQAATTPAPSDSAPSSPATPTSSLKRKDLPLDDEQSQGEDEDAVGEEDPDAEGEMDVDAEGESDVIFELNVTGNGAVDTGVTAQSEVPPPFSKEQEIEKLRTSGSMTQSISEIARVKNLNKLQIGKHEVEAWYFSPYPQEYAHLDVLYICEFCLSFFPSSFMLGRHRKRCTLLHPPGNEIYRHEDISFFEIDGKKQLTYCRNLSLLSKCFLDHKTLYYDVTPFLYYLMVQRDSHGCHLIGYFSKEKECADGYNVACILTLPQHQRHGYGKLLIEFSYELSKKEGKLGSPEKPLSDLGLLGYRAYWAETIVELLLQAQDELSIDEIARKTSITHADIMNTCTTLQLFKHHRGMHLICLSDAVLEKHEKVRNKKRRRIHPENLIWKPPVFSREQLRFGF